MNLKYGTRLLVPLPPIAPLSAAISMPPLWVSGVSGEGVRELLRAALARIRPAEETRGEAADAPWRP